MASAKTSGCGVPTLQITKVESGKEKAMRKISEWIDDHDALLSIRSLKVRVGKPKTFRVDSVDTKASLACQSRPDRFAEESVMDIVNGIKNDRPMKRLVVWEPHNKVIVLGGNCRIEAFKRESITEFEAYPVYPESPDVRIALAQQLNDYHGERLSIAIRAQQALDLHLQQGWNVKDAASARNVLPDRVKELLRIRDMQAKLTDGGIKLNGVAPTTLKLLSGAFRDKTNELRVAGRIVSEFRPTVGQVEELIGVTRNETTEAGRIAAMEKYAECLRPASDVRPRQPLKSMVLRTVSTTISLIGKKRTLASMGFTSVGERERILEAMKAAHSLFSVFIKERP